MKNLIKLLNMILLTIFIFMEIGCHRPHEPKVKKDIKFLQNKHWSQGKAEVQRYNLTINKYGPKENPTQRKSKDSMMVLVKEPWSTKLNVKTDPKTMDSAVLKFSIFDMFKTGTYPYSFKSDFFIDIDTGKVVKYVMSSQDGCGTSFFRYDKKGKTGIFTWHSYWNNHGLITLTRSAKDYETFFDALPVYLRTILDEPSKEINVVEPIIGNHPNVKNQSDALRRSYPKIIKIKVTNSQTTIDVNGKSYNVVKSEVLHGDKTNTFYFEKEFPHDLIKMDGTFTKSIYFSDFFPYWDKKLRAQPPTW